MRNEPKKINHLPPYILEREREHRSQLERIAKIGGIEWIPETNQFWWSESVYKMLGISPGFQDPTFQNLIAAIHPDDQQMVQKLVEKLSVNNDSFRVYTRLLTTAGKETPILLEIGYDEQGQKVFGYLQDISQSANERSDLIGTLAKYRGIMDGAGNAIILMSLEGNILEGNAKASEILEVDQQEMANLSVEDFHTPEDLDTMMGNYQGILWGNTQLFETTIIGKKGKQTPVEISGRPIHIGSEQILVIILHDITLQRQAQIALKRSERRYRTLVDEAREGIFLLTDSGIILAVNPRVCEISAYRTSELLKMNFRDIADFDLDINPIDLLLGNTGRHSIHMEGYIRHRQGNLIPTGFNIALSEEEGKPQFIITAYDLSEVRSGEEDRLQLQKQLFQAQKQEMLGQLAGSLAHDFNNLLSPILLVSEMLLEDAHNDPFLEKNLQNINQAAQRARRLVGRILDYTRPEDGAKSLINLRDELNETLELLRSSIPNTIAISDHYSQDDFPCLADPDQFHQIVMNIGMNAAQALEDNKGNIDISLDQIMIEENSELMNRYELPEGPYACLSVSDNGPGIPEEYLDGIFDPFFTTKTQTDGSGLGLSVVSRIATNHGGIAFAENREAGGARVSVFLPLTERRR